MIFLLAVGLHAQAPPSDVKRAAASQVAGAAQPVEPYRVFINTLQGDDQNAVAEIMAQFLYDSQKVVVTTNEGNASFILNGAIFRELVSKPHQAPGALKTAPSKPSNGTNPEGGSEATDTPLPILNESAVPVRVTDYRYELQLQLLNPAGDVVWMNGRGTRAPGFQPVDDAVGQALDSLLATLRAAQTVSLAR